MTDNTQAELDEILEMLWAGVIDNPFKMKPRHEARQAILDWHNKQTLELLDRLSGQAVTRMAFDQPSVTYVLLSAIEAERQRLKGEL